MYYTDSSHNMPLINMIPKLMLKALKSYTYIVVKWVIVVIFPTWKKSRDTKLCPL